MFRKSFRKKNRFIGNKNLLRGIIDISPNYNFNDTINKLKGLDFELFFSSSENKLLFQAYQNYSKNDILHLLSIDKNSVQISSDIDKNYVLPLKIVDKSSLIVFNFLNNDIDNFYIERLSSIKSKCKRLDSDSYYSIRKLDNQIICEMVSLNLLDLYNKIDNLEKLFNKEFSSSNFRKIDILYNLKQIN